MFQDSSTEYTNIGSENRWQMKIKLAEYAANNTKEKKQTKQLCAAYYSLAIV